jgi:hypothetical protein
LIDADPESWPRAAMRAFWLALWVIALLLLALETAVVWSNSYGGDGLPNLVVCAVLGAGLIGLPIAYRRRVPQAVRWPATKRAWLLAIPIFAVLVLPVLVFLASQLRGALRG